MTPTLKRALKHHTTLQNQLRQHEQTLRRQHADENGLLILPRLEQLKNATRP